MTAAVRKKDEELIKNLKCIISVIMTDSGQNSIFTFAPAITHIPGCNTLPMS